MQWNEFLKDLLALRAASVSRHVLCCTQKNVELHDFAIVLVKPIVQWFSLESSVHMRYQLVCGREVSTCADEEFFDRTFRTSFLFIFIKACYNGC